MANTERIRQFKLLTLGDSAVGKTSLVAYWTEGRKVSPDASFVATIGIDWQKRELEVEGTRYGFVVWDTAGQERFHTITQNYFRGSEGVAVCFDLTRRETFDQVQNWLLQLYAQTKGSGKPPPQRVLIGTKVDLTAQRRVARAEGEEMARQLGVRYFETSAVTGEGIAEAMGALAAAVVASSGVHLHQLVAAAATTASATASATTSSSSSSSSATAATGAAPVASLRSHGRTGATTTAGAAAAGGAGGGAGGGGVQLGASSTHNKGTTASGGGGCTGSCGR